MSLLEHAVIQPPLVTPDEDPVAGYVLRPDLGGHPAADA